MSSNNKVKGLLKGLRFISQIFDNEKEQEIQIGHPTDVKHVAHIGLEGPSDSSPSWMNEFDSVPGISSASLNLNGEPQSKEGPDNLVKRPSEDPNKRGSRSENSQGQEKRSVLESSSTSSKRDSMENIRESQAKEKSDRPKPPRKNSKHHHSQSKNSSNGSKSIEQLSMSSDSDSLQLIQGGSNDLQSSSITSSENVPKRSHHSTTRTTKDGSSSVGCKSSKSRSRGQHRDPSLNHRTHSRPSSKSSTKQTHFEEDGQVVKEGSSQERLRNYTN